MKLFRNRIFAIVITVALVLVAACIGFAKAPEQVIQQGDAFYISDEAGVLSADTENYLAISARSLHEDTGARFFIATVDTTGRQTTEEYFFSVAEDWNLGGYDVMLLMVIDDADYWFDFGEMWYDVLGYSYGELMNRYLEPDFAIGDYDAGAIAFHNAVCDTMRGGGMVNGGYADGYYSEPVYESSGGSGVFGILLAVIVIVTVLAIIFTISGTRRIYRPSRPYGNYRPPHTVVINTPRPQSSYRPSSAPRPAYRPASRPSSRPASRPASHSSFGGRGGGRSGGSFGSRGGGRSGGSFGSRGGGRSGGFGGGRR